MHLLPRHLYFNPTPLPVFVLQLFIPPLVTPPSIYTSIIFPVSLYIICSLLFVFHLFFYYPYTSFLFVRQLFFQRPCTSFVVPYFSYLYFNYFSGILVHHLWVTLSVFVLQLFFGTSFVNPLSCIAFIFLASSYILVLCLFFRHLVFVHHLYLPVPHICISFFIPASAHFIHHL